jgi:acyl carrier protein
MNKNDSKKIITKVITKIVNKNFKITDDMKLIGSDSPLDSMKLVEMCVALEDIAEEHDFEFIWTSEATMSKSNSIFKSIDSLAEEFANQSKTK